MKRKMKSYLEIKVSIENPNEFRFKRIAMKSLYNPTVGSVGPPE